MTFTMGLSRLSRRATVRHAAALLDAGRVDAARDLLARTLHHPDPVHTPPNRHLFDAAVLYVRVVDGDPAAVPSPLAWARYAHHTAHHLRNPDPQVLHDATAVLAVALGKAGPTDELVAACREVIDLAQHRGDGNAVVHWRLNLAICLHERGRCNDAGDEAVSAIHGYHPDTALDALEMILRAFAILDTCHRHDQATAVAALTPVEDLPDEPIVAQLLTGVEAHSASLSTHTERYHHGECCPFPGCGTAPGSARTAAGTAGQARPPRSATVAARLFAALLTGHDPAHAAPSAALIEVAERHTATLNPDTCDVPRAVDWARYAHRAALHLYSSDASRLLTATERAAASLDRLAQPAAADNTWQDTIAHTRHHGDLDTAATCQMALAARLHAVGRCGEGLTEAGDALTDWEATHGEHTQAIDIATHLLNHALNHGTPTEQADARLDLADHLLNTGRCTEGVNHARTAWHNLPHHQPPDTADERHARLRTGIRAAFLLGGCHHHEPAVKTLFDAVERYAGTNPDYVDDLTAAEDRETQWQAALAAYAERRKHHRAAHQHSPCDNEHAAEPGVHLGRILDLINARIQRKG